MTPFTNRHGRIAAAIFGVLAVSAAVICGADDRSDVPTVKVSYADLNLSSPQGANALYSRIWAAAERACRPLDGRDLRSKMQMKDCVATAVADAVTKVAHPSVVAIYNARHASPLPTIIVLAHQDH
jgi:UrcA family protein